MQNAAARGITTQPRRNQAAAEADALGREIEGACVSGKGRTYAPTLGRRAVGRRTPAPVTRDYSSSLFGN